MSAEILKTIPKLPGIYVFKGKENNILYVGKAKCLYKRVASYFRRQNEDWKVQELIREYATIEHIITKSETEALLLEAHLIRSFKPKYNVLLKNKNPFVYIVITDKEELPKINIVKSKKEPGYYFGPFLSKQKVTKVINYLTRTLKLRLCSSTIDQGCLDYHLGYCAGSCTAEFNKQEYRMRMMFAKQLLEGDYQACENLLKTQIKEHNKKLEFEKSKHINEYLKDLETIFQTLKAEFSEAKYETDITVIAMPIKYKLESYNQTAQDLQILLNLEKKPISIDCFDISHFQSSYLVGSCIRFTHGIPDRNNFRRFKIKTLTEQNDYAALQEIVARRYKNPKNLPDVILIDGGKGQLNAVKNLAPNTPFISLAKKEERLYTCNNLSGIVLDVQTSLGQLLIYLRDYAHHFAINYHKTIRSKYFEN